MNVREPVDSLQRRQAVMTPDHAFVWASAGTGKTHTLTLRALYLLLKPGERDLYNLTQRDRRLEAARKTIHSVLLSTFTRKAAAEMQARLFFYLASLTSAPSLESLRAEETAAKDPLFLEVVEAILSELEPPAFDRLRRGAEALAELAVELQVSTIHSLAAALLRRYPLEAGIPPETRFASEEEEGAVRIDDLLIERWWQHQVLREAQLQEDLNSMLEVFSVEHVREWLRAVIAEPWIVEELDGLNNPDPAQLDSALLAAEEFVTGVPNDKSRTVSKACGELAVQIARVRANETGAWTGLAAALDLHRKSLFVDGWGTNKQIHCRDRLIQLSATTQELFASFYHFHPLAVQAALVHDLAHAWSAWRHFLQSFGQWARDAVLRELGFLSFDDMIRLAVELLQRNPRIRRAERRRLRAVLIDEFQDTDPDQLALVGELLKAEKGDDAVAAFFVGDIKQSIYRFRKADVELIRDFSNRFSALTGSARAVRHFHLRTSFRSLAPLTEFSNFFFSGPLRVAAETKDHLEPFRTEGGEPCIWAFQDQDTTGGKLKADPARQYAARECARRIEELHESQAIPYRDFLILTSRNADLNQLLPVLHQRQIPVVAGGARTFFRNHEVLDVLNLLLTLHHPLDTLAMAAVVRSPLVLLSDDAMHRLFRAVPPESLIHEDAPLPGWLSEIARERILQLRNLARTRRSLPLNDWCRAVQAFIPLNAYLKPNDLEGRAIFRIQRVMETFQAECDGGRLAPVSWLLRQRERASEGDWWDGDPGEDVAVADESLDAVRALTIHKAKGLEAKVVLLFGWSSLMENLKGGRHGARNRALAIRRHGGERIRGFSLPWGRLRITTPDYGKALERDEEAAAEEAQRLTYVAATRARDRMVLINVCWDFKKYPESVRTLIEDSRQGSGTGCFRFEPVTLQEAPEQTTPPTTVVSLDEPGHRELWRRRYAALEAKQTPLLMQPSEAEGPVDSVPRHADHVRPGSDSPALQTGRLVHLFLERWLRDTRFEAANLQSVAAEVEQSENLLFLPEAVSQAAQILGRFFDGRLCDDDGRPLRERVGNSRILGRELPIFLESEGQVWHGVLDLLMEEGEMLRAVDYKTGRHRSPLPPSYLQQRKLYCEGLRRLFPERSLTFEFWWLGGPELK